MLLLKFLMPRKRRWNMTVGDMQRMVYVIGLGIGLAGMAWIYLLLLAVPALRFVTGPEKPFKVFGSMLLGIATPFWLYLPYYVYITYMVE